MKLSDKGLEFIKGFEGFRSEPYRPVATEKYLTIGYGHYGPDVRLGMHLTENEALELLRSDMVSYEQKVDKYMNVYNFNQNEYDAMVSFAYNCGSIDQLTKNGTRTKEEIADKILLYCHGEGGILLKGLERRRKEEREMFLTPVEDVKTKRKAQAKRNKDIIEKVRKERKS